MENTFRQNVLLTSISNGVRSFLSSGLNQQCYLVALFLYIWYEITKESMLFYIVPPIALNIMRFLVLGLLLACEIFNINKWLKETNELNFSIILTRIKYSSNKIKVVYAVALLATSAIAFLKSDVFFPVYTVLFIICGRKFRFREIAKCALAAMTFSVVLCIGACLIGVTPDHIWVQNAGTRVRHGLGFRYATYASHYLLYTWLLVLYLKERTAWSCVNYNLPFIKYNYFCSDKFKKFIYFNFYCHTNLLYIK